MKPFIMSVIVAGSAALGAPGSQGGFFVPFNGGWEGRVGAARFAILAAEGGRLELRAPDGRPLGRLGWVCRVAGPDGAERETAQAFDKQPVIRFLEEGAQRIGVRALYSLYDAASAYHGHGMLEAWGYPDGQVFVTAAAMFEDGSAHRGVTAAALVLEGAAARLPGGPIPVTGTNAPAEGWVAFGGRADAPAAALYWRPSWRMDHVNQVPRSEGGAPTYYRWPTFLNQAYYGFEAPERLVADPAGNLRLEWNTAKTGGRPGACFGGVFRLTADAGRAWAFARADRAPLALRVEGGSLYVSSRTPGAPGYNDQDGSYEVRKTGGVLRVTLPADPEGRTVRIKAVGLAGHGGVAAELDGKPVIPQLAGEGGIADDPLAPIREQPEGPADMALVTAELGPKPRVVTVREVEGVQLAYQNRDPWRSFCLYGTKTGPRWPGFRFSLVDGRARHMRKYGEREYALGENLLTWLSFCAYTPLQIADRLEDFAILRNGPGEAAFRYSSLNANGRVRSVYEVAVPAGSPAMLMKVKAGFEVLESWPFQTVQFFDIFPFRGVWPQEWWYDEVLWVNPDGRAKWLGTKTREFGGDPTVETFAGGGFFAFHAADRGNMLMLTKAFKPELPVRHMICGNYVDFHMEVLFLDAAGKPGAPPKGAAVSMEYELAVWGDGSVTREALIERGKRSIKAGRLVLE